MEIANRISHAAKLLNRPVVMSFPSIESAGVALQSIGSSGFQSSSVLCAEEKCTLNYKRLSLLSHPFRGVVRWLQGRRRYRVYVAKVNEANILAVPLYIDDEGMWHVAGAAFDLDVIDFCFSDRPLDELCACCEVILKRMFADGIDRLYIRELPDNSVTNAVLQELARQGAIEIPEVVGFAQSVKIELGNDYERYFGMLGKHARQNVRTAYNRLRRDGRQGSFEFWSSCGVGLDLDSSEGRSLIKNCMLVYQKRQLRRYSNKGLSCRLMRRYCDVTMSALPGENGFVAIQWIDGRIAGFMMGFVDDNVGGLMVPRLAIEERFSFYSPGLILLNETAKWLLANSKFHQIDLCRGTEKYKFDMGGVEYLTRRIQVGLRGIIS